MPHCAFVGRRAAFIMSLVVLSAILLQAQPQTTVRPTDNNAILTNPGMGWVLHHYDNDIIRYGSRLEPSDTVDDFPGIGVIYLRLAWSYLEPAEGRYNWSVVDIPAQRWIAKGKKIAFRFTIYESASNNPPNATPEWVVQAGAKVFPVRGRSGATTRYEPDYDDPILLQKLDNFFAAAAKRYDGDPNVAWIDIGTVGIWGEGDPTPDRNVTAATVRKHIDLHTRHFKKTLIAYNDNLTFRGKGLETIDYALEKGLTYRDDSILCRPGQESVYTHYYAEAFWRRHPIILESEHYGLSVQRGDWGDGSDYLRAVELAHGSYISVHWWPREFLEANRDLVRKISLRMGYRLQLLEATFPKQVPATGELRVAHQWRNGGVAPVYPGGYIAFTLKDAKDGIAGVFVDENYSVRSLTEPTARDSRFLLPPVSILKPGNYRLYVSIGTRIGTPEIALPLDHDDGARRYYLGDIEVTAAQPLDLSKTPPAPAQPVVADVEAERPWITRFERPLLKWELAIGDNKSLPWNDPSYDIANVPRDAQALLTPELPVLARMETLRRALAYSQKDPGLAYQLLSALVSRVQDAEAAAKPDPLAWFDLGYFYEAARQANWLKPDLLGDRNGYTLVTQAIRTAPNHPGHLEMEFAAGLILLEPKGQHPYYPHFKTIVKAPIEGSLLERNLLLHLKDKFEATTLQEMRTSRYLTR